jgi:exodeoxyribonuclease VII large subunit
MAVPVLRDCIDTILSLHQRMLRASSRGLDRQRRHLLALARALPRPDSLFALPRQRFDSNAGRLPGALFQNLQRHASRFARASALMRPRVVGAEIEREREGLVDLGARLTRAFGHRLRRADASLETCMRVLDSLSYRAVLARGFALVRGADGALKRCAAAVTAGEALALIFADGESKAVAGGKAETRQTRRYPCQEKGQGDLF